MIKTLTYIISAMLLFSGILSAQTVGVVLSGGGASGMAHVGMLKALEENNIPIDYIVGTSAGALVASLYANGYSPNEIDSILISKEFLLMAEGKLNQNDKFFFKDYNENASIASLKFDKNFNSESFIPTNYTFPNYLDFTFLELYGTNQGVNQDFDSLFIPFRSVAADVENNKAHIFRKGNINEAVRGSMTYPFYMKPIKIDGRYMYDGGIYNNFPSDILYDDFLPDVIIGCNLLDSTSTQSDDFFSQLKAVVLNRANNDVKCDNGIVIKPKTNIGTFDFEHSYESLIDGYNETILNMDSIKLLINKKSDPTKLKKSRKEFRLKNIKQILIDSIRVINSLTEKQKIFITKSLIKPNEKISLSEFKTRYFRLISDGMITHIFPRLILNNLTKNYTITLDVSLDKAFELGFGGVFSSSPINTGFVSVNYKKLSKSSTAIRLNSYFGKLYGSVKGEYLVDLPNPKTPLRFSAEAGINRYDYFKSYSTFFEDVKPSFIIQNEYYSGAKIHLPIKNESKITFNYNNFFTTNDYYQTDDFILTDTSDLTQFFGNKYGFEINKNSLDRKSYPTIGNKLNIDGYYVKGKEKNAPGSTSIIKDITNINREWFKFNLNYEKYISLNSNISFGIYSGFTLSTEYSFSNYFADKLYSSQFNGIYQMNTIYSSELRSNNFLSVGIKPIFILKKNIQFRNELYGFSPIISIRKNQFNQSTQLNQIFLTQYFIAKSSIVYTSPIGPLAFSIVYLQPEEDPFIFQLNFGFTIHNKRIFD